MVKKLVFILLLLLSVVSYSQAEVSSVRKAVGISIGFFTGLGFGNFIVSDIKRGFGYFFGDVFYMGLISLWILKGQIVGKARETSFSDKLGINAEVDKIYKGLDVTLMALGIVGAVSLFISRIVQLYHVSKFYEESNGFAFGKSSLKHQYAQNRNPFKNINIGLTTFTFQKTL